MRTVLVLVLVLGTFAVAAEARWKKGDTWTVKTYQRKLDVVPRAPRTLLPGARIHGVPEGYKPGSRWRLTVEREEDGMTVLSLVALEGPERRTELFFRNGRLIRVGKRVLGTATDVRESRELGFPLEWPDAFARADWKWWSSFESRGLRGELERSPP